MNGCRPFGNYMNVQSCPSKTWRCWMFSWQQPRWQTHCQTHWQVVKLIVVKLNFFFLDTSKNMLNQATIHSMLNIDLDTLNGDSYLYDLGVDSVKFKLLINLLDKHNIKYNKNHKPSCPAPHPIFCIPMHVLCTSQRHPRHPLC